MINAKAKGFAVRPAGKGIFFVWDSPTGRPVKDKTIRDCSKATLKLKEQKVLVEDVKTDNGQNFNGRIRGFEPARTEEFHGMAIGNEIEFDESHVFGASD
jgi:hypothetical protein